jgi:hypothetical protein
MSLIKFKVAKSETKLLHYINEAMMKDLKKHFKEFIDPQDLKLYHVDINYNLDEVEHPSSEALKYFDYLMKLNNIKYKGTQSYRDLFNIYKDTVYKTVLK